MDLQCQNNLILKYYCRLCSNVHFYYNHQFYFFNINFNFLNYLFKLIYFQLDFLNIFGRIGSIHKVFPLSNYLMQWFRFFWKKQYYLKYNINLLIYFKISCLKFFWNFHINLLFICSIFITDSLLFFCKFNIQGLSSF